MQYPEHIEKKGREERVYFDNAFEQAKADSKIVSVKTAKTFAREWAKNSRCAKEAEIAELQQANKALSLQNEILSGAYEASQKRAKHLEGLLEKCRKWFFLHAPTAVLPDTNGQEAHRYIADKFFVNPADLNEV